MPGALIATSEHTQLMLHLFGDESAFDTAVTYGLVMVAESDQGPVEAALIEVKSMFGGTGDMRLHCRELFHREARQKTPWRHLETEQIFELACVVGNYLRAAGARFRIGFVDRAGLGEVITFARAGNDTPTGPKQLSTFAYLASLVGLERDPGVDKLRLWVDPDPTQIEWGGRRRQSGRYPVTSEDGATVPHQVIDGEKPMLLDVADILAYCGAHALCQKQGSQTGRFRDAYTAFAAELVPMDFHPQALKPPPAG